MAEAAPIRGLLADATVTEDEFFCQSCKYHDNQTLEAVGFCVDCSELLCDRCFNCHLIPNKMRTHTLLDMEEVKKNGDSVKYRDVCTDNCVQHPWKISEYICFEHNITGCDACMTEHKTCYPQYKYIPDAAVTGVKDVEFTDAIRELETTLRRTRYLIKKSTELKSHKDCVNALENMEQMKKDVLGMFQKIEDDIRKEIDTITDRDNKRMDENIKSLEEIQTKAETLLNGLTRMRDTGRYSKAYVAMKMEKAGIQALDEKLVSLANDSAVPEYKLQSSYIMKKLLEQEDTLWTVCEQDQSVKRIRKRISKIYVRTDDDNNVSQITGMVRLNRDRLVAVDSGNNKVKLVDVKRAEVVSVLPLNRTILDITTTNETDEVAITTASRSIILLQVTGSLERSREIQTTDPCYNIASLMGRLVVSLRRPERIAIIDKEGKVLDKFGNVLGGHGGQMFGDARSVSVSRDQDRIYVADRDKDTVACLSLSGKMKAVYTDPNLRRPSCTAVDKRGSVFVAGDSNNVHQITEDCRKLRVILAKNDGIYKPISMCYYTKTDCLYVGQHGRDIILEVELH